MRRDARVSAGSVAAPRVKLGIDVAALFLLLIPLLMAGPEMLGAEPSLRPFLVLAMALIGYLFVFGRVRSALSEELYSAWPSVLFLCVLAIMFARASDLLMPMNARIIQILSVAAVFLVGFASARPGGAQVFERRLIYAFFSLPLFVLPNLFLVFSNPRKYMVGERNEILSTIGISMQRLQDLPGIHTSNVIGVMAGASALVMACLAWISPRYRLVAGVLAATSFLLLLLAETRSALLVALACVFLALLTSRRTMVRLARAALIIGTISAPLLTLVFRAVTDTGLGALLIRQGGRAFGVGTGRNYVWDAGLTELAHPSIEHLFGFGYFGQVTTGILNPFFAIFSGLTATPTMHNAFLQYVFDAGYFGAACYFAAVWSLIGVVGRANPINGRLANTVLALIIFIVVCGYTEAVGTPYHANIFILLLTLMGLSVGFVERASKAAAAPRSFAARAPSSNFARERTPPAQKS